jgi:hypothetical protein
MNALQTFSILLELAIGILGVTIWLQKKKGYGGFVFLTYAIYVFYDLARLWDLTVPEPVLRISFCIATLSMLIAVWKLYKAD